MRPKLESCLENIMKHNWIFLLDGQTYYNTLVVCTLYSVLYIIHSVIAVLYRNGNIFLQNDN